MQTLSYLGNCTIKLYYQIWIYDVRFNRDWISIISNFWLQYSFLILILGTTLPLKPCADIANCFRIFISDIFKLFFRIFSFLEFQFCADIAKLCHIELIWETYESMMPDSIVIEASIIRSSFKKFLQTLANLATLSWFGKLSKCLQDISKF